MDSLTDIELLPLLRRFEQEALAVVYDRYNNGIYYYALRQLNDPYLAEDCTAETFHRFLRALHHGGGPNDNLKGYLYSSAHNWITDYFRRKPSVLLEGEEEIVDPQDSPGEQAEHNILQGRVLSALRKLTPEQRQVILLRFVEGWNLEEVAAALQKTNGAVKALQHRAVEALKKLLLRDEIQE